MTTYTCMVFTKFVTYTPHTQDVHLSESPLGSASSDHGYAVVSYETEVYTNNV